MHGPKDLYGECMDHRLKKHKISTLIALGIDPDDYDELSWAGLCKYMAQAFREGSGPLYDFFRKNLEVSFETHGVERATLTFHNKCGAYGIQNWLEELLAQLEDILEVYRFIKRYWPNVDFRIVQQKLLDEAGIRIEVIQMTVEQAIQQLEEIKFVLSQTKEISCTG